MCGVSWGVGGAKHNFRFTVIKFVVVQDRLGDAPVIYLYTVCILCIDVIGIYIYIIGSDMDTVYLNQFTVFLTF